MVEILGLVCSYKKKYIFFKYRERGRNFGDCMPILEMNMFGL